MTYQVLARKWRPQDFDSVVGQEPVVTALRNALSEGRIAQAYLFSGIRGVGKTSVARILAKALNCEKGPTADPCGECSSCQEIASASSADMDFIEVDAATYSKVEQVRELTESLKYGPARDRYKVVVIDEIHRLSRQAFDALLKIVEEPPDHLVFIFATTESEAVPATLLSRCQEFRFRRVPSPVLAAHLRSLSEAEEIEVSDNAIRLIARAGDGSVRDSVALLDQLATFGSGEISDEEASRLLGGVDHALFLRLLAAITDGEPAEVVAVVEEVEARGWDPRHVFTEFLAYTRDGLHLALGGEPAAVDLPEEEARSLQERATAAGYETLLRLLHHLLASENAVRRSEAGALALEIAWLRAAELPKLTRIEELLGGSDPGDPGPTAGSGGKRGRAASSAPPAARKAEAQGRSGATRAKDVAAPAPPPNRAPDPPMPAVAAPSGEPPPEPPLPESQPGPAAPRQSTPDEPAPQPPPGPTATHQFAPSEPAPEPPPGPAAEQEASPDEPAAEPPPEEYPAAAGNETVIRFLQQVSLRKQPLAAHLALADRLVFEDNRLLIYAPVRDEWLTAERLARDSNRAVLEEAMAAVWGEGGSWRLRQSQGVAAQQKETKPAPPAEVLDNPRVQAVLDIFGGAAQTMEEHDSGETQG